MELSTPSTILISAAIFAAAFSFALAGHTGASAYLALLGLPGMTPDVIKPPVLALNFQTCGCSSCKGLDSSKR